MKLHLRLRLPLLWSICAAALLAISVPAFAVEGVSKYPEEYLKLIQRVSKAFYSREYDDALAMLSLAEKLVPPTATTLNIRGAIAIERRDFTAGRKYCEDALKLDPKFFASQFNLGEIPFLQGDYAAARKIYEALYNGDGKNDLTQYRIFLTYLLEKNDEKAAELLEKFKFPADTGAYYYAHAAWDYAHGEPDKAATWIRSGDWVFSPARNIDYAEVIYDLKWAERPARAKLTEAEKPKAEAPPAPPAN